MFVTFLVNTRPNASFSKTFHVTQQMLMHEKNKCDPYRVKTGNFGHQVNSDIHLQTVEIQMRRLLMSCLIRIFTVCLANLFLYSNN